MQTVMQDLQLHLDYVNYVPHVENAMEKQFAIAFEISPLYYSIEYNRSEKWVKHDSLMSSTKRRLYINSTNNILFVCGWSKIVCHLGLVLQT